MCEQLKVNEKRENIGVKQMKEYEYGGLAVDELQRDGYTLFIPYGIHVDIFDTIADASKLIQKEIREVKQQQKELRESDIGEHEVMVGVLEDYDIKIQKLEEQKMILETIAPIVDLV